MNKSLLSVLAIATLSVLAACGGSGDSANDPTASSFDGVYVANDSVVVLGADGSVFGIDSDLGLVLGTVEAPSGSTLTGSGTAGSTAETITGTYVSKSSLSLTLKPATGVAAVLNLTYSATANTPLATVPAKLYSGTDLHSGEPVEVNVAANGGFTATEGTCQVSGTLTSTKAAYDSVRLTLGTGCDGAGTSADGVLVASGTGYLIIAGTQASPVIVQLN